MLNKKRPSVIYNGLTYKINAMEAEVFYKENPVLKMSFSFGVFNDIRKWELMNNLLELLSEYTEDDPFAAKTASEQPDGEDSAGLFDYEEEEEMPIDFPFDDLCDCGGNGQDEEAWEEMLCKFGVDEDI